MVRTRFLNSSQKGSVNPLKLLPQFTKDSVGVTDRFAKVSTKKLAKIKRDVVSPPQFLSLWNPLKQSFFCLHSLLNNAIPSLIFQLGLPNSQTLKILLLISNHPRFNCAVQSYTRLEEFSFTELRGAYSPIREDKTVKIQAIYLKRVLAEQESDALYIWVKIAQHLAVAKLQSFAY